MDWQWNISLEDMRGEWRCGVSPFFLLMNTIKLTHINALLRFTNILVLTLIPLQIRSSMESETDVHWQSRVKSPFKQNRNKLKIPCHVTVAIFANCITSFWWSRSRDTFLHTLCINSRNTKIICLPSLCTCTWTIENVVVDNDLIGFRRSLFRLSNAVRSKMYNSSFADSSSYDSISAHSLAFG